jgi:hypothetical protein
MITDKMVDAAHAALVDSLHETERVSWEKGGVRKALEAASQTEAERPSVDEIIQRIRAAIADPACTAFGLDRAEAEAIIFYFDDLSSFAEMFAPTPKG